MGEEERDNSGRKFSIQRAITKFVSKHDIPLDLVFNLDQTLFSYVSRVNFTFDLKGVDDKRQITATFMVSASGPFLPIQLLNNGKTSVVYPNTIFPNYFDVAFTPNRWSNFGPNHWYMCLNLFERTIFPISGEEKRTSLPKGTILFNRNEYLQGSR